MQTKPALQRVVVGLPVLNNDVLLGLRKKVSRGLGQNLISGIGGKCEENASDEQALIREFSEEVMIKLREFNKVGEVIFLFPHKPKWNQKCSIYVVNKWDKIPAETDVIKPLWFQKNKLPKTQMWQDNLLWLPLILQNKKVKGIFLYNEVNNVIENTLEEI